MPELHQGGVDSYPNEYLPCRVYGHAWNESTEDWRPTEQGGKIVEWECWVNCARCPAHKIYFFDPKIYPTRAAKIDYTDCPGYLTAKGEKFSRHEARAERFRRRTGRAHLRRVH